MPDAVQFSSKQPSAGGPTSEVSNVKLDAVVTSRNICDVSEGLDTSSSAAEAEESSDSDSEIHSINTNIKDQIQQWALKYQIPQNALNELLTILRDNSNTDFKIILPKDSRSLLKTPKFNNIIPMGHGKYWYNGIENCLKEVLSQMISDLPTCIFLSFNIDGLPVANSTKNEFWPILCKIDGMDVAPLVIAIFFGSSKPCLELFLRPFVNELIKLLQDGLLIQRQIVPIKIRCFICDTPARCFIKGTVGFTSYHGCMKCTVIGEYDRKGRHMSFPRTDMALRTDHSFRNRLDPDHHKEKSPIEDLPIDLVNDFTIADALHLLDLGVMKRCLLGWTNGSFNFRTKWSAREIQDVSRKLMEIKSTTPSEIHQGRLRELDTLHFWKDKANDIVVTWSTFNDTQDSRVQYGEGYMDKEATGFSKLFVDGGRRKRRQYIHTVTLKDLKFDTSYVYHVGSVYGWSEEFIFHTAPEGEDWPVRAAIYGDMGSGNAQSLSYLQDEAQRNKFDVILHVGDFAYDMDSKNALVGDEFMRQIQPLATVVPYMTCPGNHEEKYNFSNYAARFAMPGPDSSLFYSFDLGPVHFVSISTEVYYYINYGIKLISAQYDWLKEDLEKANLPENRSRRPWIVLFGHRPMYCNDRLDVDCNMELTRIGLHGLWPLEPLLKDYGVDLVIWAHDHLYERSFPLYDNKVYNGSTEYPYVNPGAPVHIITGSAGCKEGHSHFKDHPAPWSAFRSSDYGYTRFEAHNKTHVYMEQVNVEQNGQVIDSLWLVKDLHKPYDI